MILDLNDGSCFPTIHVAPRPDILSPLRQLLSLPIPCPVHWPRSCCRGRACTAAICRKPCFLDQSVRAPTTACVLGPCLRAGCAHAARVSGWSLGNCMGAGGRCMAPCMDFVCWSDPDRSGPVVSGWCAGGRVGGWSTRCLPVVRGRVCVDVWAGVVSCGSLRAVAQGAI